MKRLFIQLVLLWAVVGLHAQDFQLYYANNIRDVADLSEITQPNSGLTWREVKSGDIAGNQIEVDGIFKMFNATTMKGRLEQERFWRMRDNTLLCFRINDGAGTTGAYAVTMTAGAEKRTVTASAYFFVNVPFEIGEAKIEVAKLTDVAKKIVFTYYIYDWGNESLYTFQLDQKRQAINKTYQLEYQLLPFEADENTKPTTYLLDLQNDKFQSFYVPAGYVLTGAWLRDGKGSDAPRLRLNTSKFWRGADLADHFSRPQLSTAFKLDKHENRDLCSFNMLGSGLMAQYDYLSLKVLGKRSRPVMGVHMNVERVDTNGKSIADDEVGLQGYDSKTQSYKVYTKGQPCYIEVIAEGYFPMVYKYSGAIDSKTNELTAKNCTGQVQLKRGDFRAEAMALSNQEIAYQHERKAFVPRNGELYSVFDEKLIDMAAHLTKDTLLFCEDGGYQGKKIMNDEPVEKFGQMRLSMSVPKGNALSGQPSLTMLSTKDSKSYAAKMLAYDNLLSKDFPKFERDYYGMRFELVGVLPKNEVCQPLLKLGTKEYKDFPKILRQEIDREKIKKQGGENTKKALDPQPSPMSKPFTDSGFDWMLGRTSNTTFSFSEKLRLSFKPTIDFIRGVVDLDIEASFNDNRQSKPGKDKDGNEVPLTDRQKYANSLRDDYTKKNVNGVTKFDDGTTYSNNNAGLKSKQWEVNELDDIMKVDKFAFGLGWYGNAKIGLSCNLFKSNNNESAFTFKNIDATFGYGFFAAATIGRDQIVEKMPDLLGWVPQWINFGLTANAALYAQLTIGLKRYQYLRNSKTESRMGWLLNGELTGKVGMELFSALDFQKFSKAKDQPADQSTEKKDEAKDHNISLLNSPKNFTTHTPRRAVEINPNSMFSFAIKGRAGLKASLQFGTGGPLDFSTASIGAMGLLFAGVGYSVEFKSCLFSIRKAGTWAKGGKYYWPDNNTNPLHPSYPYWVSSDKNNRALLFNPAMLSAQADSDQKEEAEEEMVITMGQPMVTGLMSEAHPQLLSDYRMVVSNEGTTADRNDNTIQVHSLKNAADVQELSTPGLAAAHHDSDHRGGHEVVAFEQMKRKIEDSEIKDDNWENLLHSNEAEKNTQIVASIRQADGTWKQTVVDDAEGYVKSNPKVAQQEDGSISCVWKRGNYSYTLGNGTNEVFYRFFDGSLMSSVYNPQTAQWSTPTAVMTLDSDHIATDYDVVMKDHTMLVAVNCQKATINEAEVQQQTLTLISQKNGSVVNTVTESAPTQGFSLARVGENPILAYIYENPDSTRDIHVKTLNMDGTIGEQGEASLGLRTNRPNTVKIVSDKKIDRWNDFAILWTESGTTVRTASQGEKVARKGTNRVQTVLNAARVFKRQSLEMMPYLSLGISNGNLDITGYDAFMDDAQISSVYALTNERTDQTQVVMYNQSFYNDFAYNISYTRRPLQSNKVLPVNINISNTGTSPITKVTGTLNGQSFSFDGLNVPPFETETLTWDYQVPDKFDGYLTANVTVDYFNQYQAKTARRANGEEVSLESTSKEGKGILDVPENVECKLLGQSVYYDEDGKLINAFEVEVTDHSDAGLLDMHKIWVGIYPDAGSAESITYGAEVELFSGDFEQVGDERKAWTTVLVENVKDDIPAYLNLFVTGVKIDPDDPDNLAEADVIDVENLYTENLHVVNLYATPDDEEDPTAVQQIKQKPEHKVTVSKEAGGIRLSRLETGETVRIFHIDGKMVFKQRTATESLFIPLSQHGTYILSASGEVFKFMF